MSQDLINKLNDKLAVDDAIRFELGEGGLTRIRLKRGDDEAVVYQHGAHVTHYKPAGHEPVLWMSGSSWFQKGKPIRGGVPICFPWFGPKADDADAPGHGFARTSNWKVRTTALLEDGSPCVTLILDWTPNTKKLYDGAFAMVYTVTLGDRLELSLTVSNHADRAMPYEAALHSYFVVGDVRQVSIEGLAGTRYIDKVDAMMEKPQGDEPVTFTSETDRVYMQHEGTCLLRDPTMGRTIRVEKEGSASTVVWNPWIDKAKRMPDYSDEEWPGMVCIETANVGGEAVSLAAGASHTMRAILSVD